MDDAFAYDARHQHILDVVDAPAGEGLGVVELVVERRWVPRTGQRAGAAVLHDAREDEREKAGIEVNAVKYAGFAVGQL